MSDWRPISLCNVIYKLLSKVLANRLKQVIPKCISLLQSDFIEGRYILDNALVAFEIIQYMKYKTKGKIGDVALKIDIGKAYDRVNWGYLKAIMGKMAFLDYWINRNMLCVESVSYSILFNYDKVGPIFPGRGLRQGDPLSPYLFIIFAEGLFSLIRQAGMRGDIYGGKICRGAPTINHLLFVDDFFSRAQERELNAMKKIMDDYELASGQAINLHKSKIIFSRSVNQPDSHALSSLLWVQICLGTGKYLGLPSMIGRSKKSSFNCIKDHIWKKN